LTSCTFEAGTSAPAGWEERETKRGADIAQLTEDTLMWQQAFRRGITESEAAEWQALGQVRQASILHHRAAGLIYLINRPDNDAMLRGMPLPAGIHETLPRFDGFRAYMVTNQDDLETVLNYSGKVEIHITSGTALTIPTNSHTIFVTGTTTVDTINGGTVWALNSVAITTVDMSDPSAGRVNASDEVTIDTVRGGIVQVQNTAKVKIVAMPNSSAGKVGAFQQASIGSVLGGRVDAFDQVTIGTVSAGRVKAARTVTIGQAAPGTVTRF
jgi:hypothetical protein